jgi:hypothetical protein
MLGLIQITKIRTKMKFIVKFIALTAVVIVTVVALIG